MDFSLANVVHLPNSTFFLPNFPVIQYYSGKVWQGNLGKFTLFEHLAKKIGELTDFPKGYQL